RTHPVEHLAPRDAHLLRRRHAHVEKEIRVMRRPRHAPAKTALDRTDVHDRLRAVVGIRRIVLPRRDPLLYRVEHAMRAQDRVLVALALAERRVDEVPLHADPQPQRSEVAEYDLALR